MKSVEALLEPVMGYLDLGMYEEAQAELEGLPPKVRNHPWALLARFALLVETKQWEEGVDLGLTSCHLWPDEFEFRFKTAYCLHELKRTDEARQTLESAPIAIRRTALYFYNLACYMTQLGREEEALDLLETCFKMDPGFHREAQDDPDLAPIRGQL